MSRRKMLLGVMAAGLALALSISGSLMYFTSQSPESVNVVSIIGLDLKLSETGDPGSADILSDGDGLDYGVVVPGVPMAKKPVARTLPGNVDSFVRAEVSLSWLDGDEPLSDRPANLDAVNERILKSLKDSSNANWLYEDGYFYYVDDKTAAAPTLKVLEGGNTTSGVFDSFAVPENIPGELGGKTLHIDIKAFAAQSRVGDFTELSDYFG
jgi:predicted ribosomally synthesized peptide with SipW-like signal peptide